MARCRGCEHSDCRIASGVEPIVPLARARITVGRIVHGLAVWPGGSMSGRLPGWLAEWLGVPIPTNADTATWQLDSRWTLSPWATLLLVLAAIVWTASVYAHESGTAS